MGLPELLRAVLDRREQAQSEVPILRDAGIPHGQSGGPVVAAWVRARVLRCPCCEKMREMRAADLKECKGCNVGLEAGNVVSSKDAAILGLDVDSEVQDEA